MRWIAGIAFFCVSSACALARRPIDEKAIYHLVQELKKSGIAAGRRNIQTAEFQRGLRMPCCMATATASVRSPTSSLALMWLM